MSRDPKKPVAPLDSDDPDSPPKPTPPPAPKKRRFSRMTLIIGAIILIFICGGIGSLFTNDDAADEPTAEVADQPAVTDEPAEETEEAEAPEETEPPASTVQAPEPTQELATPTDEIAPTTPPEPTVPPTAAPSATPADPVETLRTTIDEALGESNRDLDRKLNLFDVEAIEGSLLVGWAADDNFSADLIRGGMQLDTVEVLKAIDESGIPFDWVYIGSTFAMQDQFGNVDEMEVLTLAYSAETLDRINWDNFIFSNVFDIADTFVLHPEFQGD